MMQIIGLCRFSYPCTHAFVDSYANLSELQKYLFDEKRMESRFLYFEHIHLPGIRNQTDPDFVYIVLAGDDLPEKYQIRLAELLVDIPQAAILFMPPMNRNKACFRAVSRFINSRSGPVAQFFLDDDDAVSVDFVASLRNDFNDCIHLYNRNECLILGYSRGLIVNIAHGSLRTCSIFRPFWTCALAMITEANDLRLNPLLTHNKLLEYSNTVTFQDDHYFLRGERVNRKSW